MSTESKFFGFYRGIVKDNDDSSQKFPYRARIKVFVPQVYGTEIQIPSELPWAEPCMPIFGGGRNDKESHGCVAIPPLESSVWVGFEQGDPTSPIWFGTWYGTRDKGSDVCEMGPEARIDSRTGTLYPKLAVIKAPWAPEELHEDYPDRNGVFLRFVEGRRVEIVFHEGHNYIELDGAEKKILVNASGWDVEVRSRTLNRGTFEEPRAQGGGINVVATPFTGGTEEDPITVGGEIMIQGYKVYIGSTDDMVINAGGRLLVAGTESARLASENAIYGSSPQSSGFERHG